MQAMELSFPGGLHVNTAVNFWVLSMFFRGAFASLAYANCNDLTIYHPRRREIWNVQGSRV